MPSLVEKIAARFPRGQIFRYLIVGGFNTIFGYGTFVVINYFLHRRNVPVSYLFALTLSNFINITVAFLGYKIFVFKTKGNYLREWLKAMAVYWSSLPLGLVLLPLVVRLMNWALPPQIAVLHHIFSRKEAAPYIANALLTVTNVLYSFFGHKHITFRRRPETPAPDTRIS